MDFIPKIVLIPTQGFCNRLRAIASAYILAKFLKTELYVNWLKEECCNCSFEEIFVTTFKSIDINKILNHKYFFSPHTHTNNIMNTLHNYEYIVIQGGHEFKHPDMSICDFLNEKHLFYKSLQFTSSIMNIVNHYDTTSCIGIHYRDFVSKYDSLDGRDCRKISPLDEFVKIILNLYKKNNKCVFFVSSNTSKAFDTISKHIPSTNIKHITDIDYNRDTSSGVIFAVANLLLLSKCKYVVGTSMSSYSDEACFFNNISKLCIGNEKSNTYHCYGFHAIFEHYMLLPDFNVLYDIFNI